jgi:hypothetical protein
MSLSFVRLSLPLPWLNHPWVWLERHFSSEQLIHMILNNNIGCG